VILLLCALLLLGQSVSGQELELENPGNPATVVEKEVAADSGLVDGAKVDPAVELQESPEKSATQSLRTRLICYAFFGGLLLVFLAILFGYLRLDHATRGFHSGRLQIAALVLSAVVLAASYLVWTQVLFQ